MTVTQAIYNAVTVTGQVFSADTLRRWLSELDGQLAFDLYGADTWTAYCADDDGVLLLVPYPWDGLYVHYLEAQTYYANGEYDRAANARAQYDNALGEFKRFVQRTRAHCGEVTVQQAGDGGTAVTMIERGCDVWRYMSAYKTAVLRGFEGTQDEWLDSLKGAKGDPGNVDFDELTPEQIAMLKGEPGEDGADGQDGISPVLSIGTVTTLGPTASATASMGGTQAAPTLNLGIPAANLWTGTQAEYDAITTKDPARLYLIYRSPAAIAVTKKPTKITYTAGESLALAGIAVSLAYDDGSAELVTEDCSFSPADGTTLSTAGTVTITASYTLDGVTFTATTTVTVNAA